MSWQKFSDFEKFGEIVRITVVGKFFVWEIVTPDLLSNARLETAFDDVSGNIVSTLEAACT
jgi:hypothetical protein